MEAVLFWTVVCVLMLTLLASVAFLVTIIVMEWKDTLKRQKSEIRFRRLDAGVCGYAVVFVAGTQRKLKNCITKVKNFDMQVLEKMQNGDIVMVKGLTTLSTAEAAAVNGSNLRKSIYNLPFGRSGRSSPGVSVLHVVNLIAFFRA